MSHPGKVDLLTEAQAAGYRTYLYFVIMPKDAILGWLKLPTGVAWS